MKTEENNTGTVAYDGIEVAESPEKVTITITGKALANVREMQGIINRLQGTEDSAADFVWDTMLLGEQWQNLGTKRPRIGETQAGFVCSLCGEENGRTLARAFEEAGFKVA